MRDLLYGTPAVILWSLIAAGFVFGASYAALVTSQVGGLRGVALIVLCLGLAIVSGGLAILLAHSPLISTDIVAVAISTAFYPVLLASLILVDTYAADYNDHRSVSTILYLWFKRAFSKEREVRR